MVRRAGVFVVHVDLDEREGTVLMEVRGPGALEWATKQDLSIGGARWEGVDGDPEYAVAFPCDWPGLVAQLEKEGYTLNLDNYSPPSETDRKE